MGPFWFTAILEPAEEGGFVIKCLELPIATQGETREEALENLKEAIEGYLEVKAESLRDQSKRERIEIIVQGPSKRRKYGIRKGMRVLVKDIGEGVLITPITPIEDLAGVDAGKVSLRQMRKKLDELRSRDRY